MRFGRIHVAQEAEAMDSDNGTTTAGDCTALRAKFTRRDLERRTRRTGLPIAAKARSDLEAAVSAARS